MTIKLATLIGVFAGNLYGRTEDGSLIASPVAGAPVPDMTECPEGVSEDVYRMRRILSAAVLRSEELHWSRHPEFESTDSDWEIRASTRSRYGW